MKKRNIIISFALCIICFVIGLIIPKFNGMPRTGDIKEINGVKVIINDDNNNTQKYINNLKTMPKYLYKNVDEIIITDENINEALDLNIKTRIIAVTIGKRIYINNQTYSDKAIIHELFHVYDVENDMLTEKDHMVKEIYKKEGKKVGVSPGNKENIQEFFATAGEMYFTSNEELLECAPETYNYIKNIIEKERTNDTRAN